MQLCRLQASHEKRTARSLGGGVSEVCVML
jgi:hypothetical protein